MQKLFIVLLILSTSLTKTFPSTLDSAKYKENLVYQLQTGLYEVYKTKKADVVMLGNSITAGCNWNELLGRDGVVERGVVSDVLEGFIARLPYVFKLNPKVVFVMGGINDLYSGNSVETTFERYTRLITEIRNKNIKVVVQSTLYVNPKWKLAKEKNVLVEALNNLLENYCKNQKIEFIDLNKQLAKDKVLQNEYTWDGLHINSKAYRIWGDEVEKVLKKMELLP